MAKRYTKELRLKVAREAIKPEYDGLEHILAEKYGVMPWTVIKWKELYLLHGENGFKKGFVKTSREKQLEKENEELRQEVEILKKAAAFLANVKRD